MERVVFQRFFKTTLFLLFLSGLYGVLLRINFLKPLKFIEYKNILQGHSHVAFLGWGFVSVIIAILYLFLPSTKQIVKKFKILLSVLLVTVFLMLFSFPLVGYKSFSIVLLSVFGLVSYYVCYLILLHNKEKGTSKLLLKNGIYYYFLSSLATWFLVYVIIVQGKSVLYYNTIYFYLHFLYNGFFVFALFALFFKLIDSKKIFINSQDKNWFFIFLNVACIPTYFLSVLWSSPHESFYFIGFIGGVLQVISLFYLLKICLVLVKQWRLSFISKLLFYFFILAFIVKISSQLVSAFPSVQSYALGLKSYVIIGYLHLFTLAFMSVFIFFVFIESGLFKIISVVQKFGIFIFLGGILVTEALLFLQAFLVVLNFPTLTFFQHLMVFFSSCILIGLILIGFNRYKMLK